MIQGIKKQIQVFSQVLDNIPEIAYVGNAVLRQKTKKVTVEEGLRIAGRLEDVLLRYRNITSMGRGLAAPQIGESGSVFITYIDDVFDVFINPLIMERSEGTNFYKELCMSAGVVAADVERPEWIVMEWTDKNGIKQLGRFDEFKARLYQHEEAHLRGRLNLDDAANGGIQFVTFDPLKEQLRTSHER